MRIVVGVDGSPESGHAAHWAAEEALRHGYELELVHAEIVWRGNPLDEARNEVVRDRIRANTEAFIGEVVELVRGTGVTPAVQRLPGDPVDVLLERAAGAALLVVGGHGGGGFRGMLLGSVAHAVTGRASCPVAVIRDSTLPPEKEIVVGVADGDEAALRFALAEADAHGARLTVVHVWRRPPIGDPTAMPRFEDLAFVQDAEARLLHAAVVAVTEGRTGQAVTEKVVAGHPVQVLSDMSAGAAMTVVGSRGRSGYALGSVSHGLIQHARGPVIVVRP